MTVSFKRSSVTSDTYPAIVWKNILGYSTPTATTEATNGEAENVIDEATNTYWTPTALPATITFNLDTSRTAGYLGVASHNLATSQCSITLEEYSGGSWNVVFTHTPTDDSIILFPFTEDTSDQWRVIVDGVSAPSIGVLFLGEALQFETGILPAYTPLYMAEDVELLTSRTITGQFMPNRVQRKGLSTSFSLNILDRAFVEGTDFQNFRRYYNDGGPFFFMSNPSGLTEDVSYCWRQDGGEIKPTFENDGIFYKASLSLEGFID